MAKQGLPDHLVFYSLELPSFLIFLKPDRVTSLPLQNVVHYIPSYAFHSPKRSNLLNDNKNERTPAASFQNPLNLHKVLSERAKLWRPQSRATWTDSLAGSTLSCRRQKKPPIARPTSSRTGSKAYMQIGALRRGAFLVGVWGVELFLWRVFEGWKRCYEIDQFVAERGWRGVCTLYLFWRGWELNHIQLSVFVSDWFELLFLEICNEHPLCRDWRSGFSSVKRLLFFLYEISSSFWIPWWFSFWFKFLKQNKDHKKIYYINFEYGISN